MHGRTYVCIINFNRIMVIGTYVRTYVVLHTWDICAWPRSQIWAGENKSDRYTCSHVHSSVNTHYFSELSSIVCLICTYVCMYVHKFTMLPSPFYSICVASKKEPACCYYILWFFLLIVSCGERERGEERERERERGWDGNIHDGS